ncbi:PREDICTED: leptin receptor gene-related protein-like [Amphimedon queenslandica]|uniref:Leptin receptor overlapping transcript-like 1 n=1 Tax=Amphimedon queenslandica TaxID=400682 RepID=A0A1X7UPW8_AMPQE|nr:PREDICTED: leptin receptor gene-related protein-like [Amphimedon queenslandica]|eukprot:XP_003387198.1 PREDICTED: leptin receptor gene-related protein-like [Amphimedon queenslandica]
MELKCNKGFLILIGLALSATIGIILLFVGCALHYESANEGIVNWWGLFVLIFYLLAPVPLTLAKLCTVRECASEESLKVLYDICYFISACIVVSGFGLPAVMARNMIIEYGAAGIIGGANIFVFSTVYAFFAFFTREEEWDWTSDDW